jgi:hypothetical protein
MVKAKNVDFEPGGTFSQGFPRCPMLVRHGALSDASKHRPLGPICDGSQPDRGPHVFGKGLEQ